MSHLVTFRLDADTLALLDREAKRTSQSRSETVRLILRTLLVGKLPVTKPTMRVKYAQPLSKRHRALRKFVGLPALPNEGR
jgi:hypothetical protein